MIIHPLPKQVPMTVPGCPTRTAFPSRHVLLAAVVYVLLVAGCVSVDVMSGSVASAPSPAPTGEAVATAAVAPSPVLPPKSFWMVAVGDIMLDRNVGRSIERWGPASMVEKVRRQLSQANLTFANLECPLSTEGAHDPANCCFRADPRAVEVLRAGGIDLVSLANNHFLNGGREAVLQTLDLLDQHHIAYAGARRDREKGLEPTFVQVGQVKVGALAFTDLSFEHGSYAKYDRDPVAARAAVTEARKHCDLLLVSVHWGEEYESMPSARQRETARALIDAGADCILGHHPHTLQGIAVYRGRPILYSMGNFIFDQREGQRMESAIFDLWWKQNGAWQIRATPIWIESGRFRPVYPSAERARKITARLDKITSALGTKTAVRNGCLVVRLPQ